MKSLIYCTRQIFKSIGIFLFFILGLISCSITNSESLANKYEDDGIYYNPKKDKIYRPNEEVYEYSSRYKEVNKKKEDWGTNEEIGIGRYYFDKYGDGPEKTYYDQPSKNMNENSPGSGLLNRNYSSDFGVKTGTNISINHWGGGLWGGNPYNYWGWGGYDPWFGWGHGYPYSGWSLGFGSLYGWRFGYGLGWGNPYYGRPYYGYNPYFFGYPGYGLSRYYRPQRSSKYAERYRQGVRQYRNSNNTRQYRSSTQYRGSKYSERYRQGARNNNRQYRNSNNTRQYRPSTQYRGSKYAERYRQGARNNNRQYRNSNNTRQYRPSTQYRGGSSNRSYNRSRSSSNNPFRR